MPLLNNNNNNNNQPTQQQLKQLLDHIALKWADLQRTNSSILDLIQDPKISGKPNQKLKVYCSTLPGSDPAESLKSIKERLLNENPLGDLDCVEILELPPDRLFPNLADHGALYLPYPYVVPGGRFQEMYAWDSFFIALGLIRDNRVRLARNILDNYIYQIEHYGTILNGNRTYYLTRSQLPFLTPLIKLILPTIAKAHRQAWLRRAILAAEAYHRYWTTGAHRVKSTGLSRFYDSGPPGSSPPELVHETDPIDGSTAHARVKRFFRLHYHQGIPDYDISKYYDYEKDKLTAKYMDNDRAMRESGFDTSTRFGPFNSKILDFNPVCLNSLIYLMEKEIGELYGQVEGPTQSKKNKAMKNSKLWQEKARERAILIRKYNWDEESGVYFDYDYVRKERRKYAFGTMFLPLWTGLSSATEAQRVASAGLEALEIAGGLSTSARAQGDQWDKPYVWAPLQLFAVDGLRRYGFDRQADRLAANFSSMVLKTWISSGQLWEKYNGLRRDQSVDLKFGYTSNEVGFGWTNAVFTRFYDQLKAAGKDSEILLWDGIAVPTDAAAVGSGEAVGEAAAGGACPAGVGGAEGVQAAGGRAGDGAGPAPAGPGQLPDLTPALHALLEDVELLDWVQIGSAPAV